MPFSHFKMVESFDWTTVYSDLILRYQVPASAGSLTIGAGRFGGNGFYIGGRTQFFFQKVGADVGPWGPNVTFGTAWFNTGIVGNFPVFEIWHGAFGGGGSPQFTIDINSAGLLEARNGNFGAILATGTTVMLINTWYYIEATVHIDPAAGTVQAQIDGVNQFTVAGVNTQGAGDNLFDSVLLTQVGANVFALDDIYVKDTAGMLGERRVILQKPASDSAPLQWTPSGGVTHFNLVNEVPPDGDATFVSSATAGQIDTYGMTALPYAPATIDTVQTSMYLRKDDAGARQDSIVVNGITSAVVITVASSYNDYIEMWDLNPATAAAWAGTAVPATMGINEVA
jgi:hypothetical protein